MSDDVLTDVLLTGPGWEARARVLELAEPVPDRGSRLVDARGIGDEGADRSTTHAARLLVQRVKVALPGWRGTWGRSGQEVAVDVLVEPGRVRGGAAPRQDLVLVAGRVPLDELTLPTDVDGLGELVGLGSVGSAGLADVDGVVVVGTRRLPWMRPDDPPLTAPFRVRVEGREVHVRPVLDRLPAGERAAWVASWARLGRDLDSSDGVGGGLEWTELRVTNPREVPDLTFVVEGAGEDRVERTELGEGALTLTVSDAARGVGGGTQGAALTLVPSRITFESSSGSTTVTVADGDATAGGTTLAITAVRDPDDAWSDESAVLAGRFHPDPVALATSLRRQGHEVDPLPVFTVLDDGWLETWTPDLRDDDYAVAARRLASDGGDTAVLAVHDVDRATVGAGAVVWGNDDPDQRDVAPSATPWGLAVVGVAAFAGTWTLEPASSPAVLRAVSLQLVDVAATLDGAWSIAATPPDPGQHLPTVADWTGAVRPVAVHTGGTLANRRPSPVALDVEEFRFEPRRAADGARIAGARATSLRVEHVHVAAVLEALDRRLPPGRAWLRHPTLPTITTLAMTRTALVDPTPSPHRQLVPCERVSTDPWRIESGTETGWGTVDRASLRPHAAWAARPHLEQVLLSLPGASLRALTEAAADPEDGRLGWWALAYRHDLPYLDEVAATATVDESGVADARRPGSLEALWDVLEERARLAALHAADAAVVAPVSLDGASTRAVDVVAGRGGAAVDGLVDVDLSAFPGGLAIGDPADPPAQLGGDARLAGVTLGDVVGGSTALDLVDGVGGVVRLRDQQGVERAASVATDVVTDKVVHAVVTTEVVDGEASWTSTSLRTPVRLAGADRDWSLWFRGLPMRATDGVLRFDRGDLPTWASHEWRLRPVAADDDTDASRRLRLGGLDVHPLSLERVVVADATVQLVELRVRLQLPSGGPAHRPELDAVAVLRFAPDLVEVRPAHEHGGVLDLRGGSGVEARARWQQLRLDEGTSGDEATANGTSVDGETPTHGAGSGTTGAGGSALVVEGVVVDFHLFDVEWSVPMGSVRLPIGPDPERVTVAQSFDRPADTTMWTAALVVAFGLGPDATDGMRLEVALDLGARDVEASVPLDVLVEEVGDGADAADAEVSCFGGRLHTVVTAMAFGRRSVQATWLEATAAARVELLPGFPLDETPRPGALTVVFEPVSAGAAATPPSFRVSSAHVELLLGASTVVAGGRADPELAGVDRVHASFLGRSLDGPWSSTLTLDGVVTATSAIAFTGRVAGAEDLFAATDDDERPLVRHHARLLLDQHELSGLRRLEEGDEERPPALFGLSAPVELTMVVEHVLEGLAVRGDGRERHLGDHRFSVPQVVRLWRPEDAVADLDRRWGAEGALLGGTADPGVREAARAAFAELTPDSLVIAADVSAYVARAGRAPRRGSRLRALPIGLQRVVRAALDELLEVGPPGSSWAHVSLPFLSCTGAATGDAGEVLLAPPSTPAAPPGAGEGHAARLAWALRGPAVPEVPSRAPLPVDHEVRDVVAVSERRLVAAWTRLAEAPLASSPMLAPVTAVRPDAIGRTGHPSVLSAVLETGPRSADDGGREGETDRGGGPWDVAFADPGWVRPRLPRLVDASFAGVTVTSGTIDVEVAGTPPALWHHERDGLVATPRGAASRGGRALVAATGQDRAPGPAIASAAVRSGGVTLVVRCTPSMQRPQHPRHLVSVSTPAGLSVLDLTQVGPRLEVTRVVVGDDGPFAVLFTTEVEGPVLARGQAVEVAVSAGADGTTAVVVDGRSLPLVRSSLPTDGSWRRRAEQLLVDGGEAAELSLGNRASGDDKIWPGTYHRVEVLAGVVDPGERDGGAAGDLPWLATGLRAVRALGAYRDPSAAVHHHLAAAHVPAAGDRAPLVVPSPFVSFGLVEPPTGGVGSDTGVAVTGGTVTRLVRREATRVAAAVAELVADPDGVLRPIASRLWTATDGPVRDDDVLAWAAEVRRREAAGAARALVRLREVVAGGRATAHRFLLLDPVGATTRLGWRAQPLRAPSPLEVTELAHVDDDLARDVLAVDVAAPVVVGAQALRGAVDGPAAPGLAALRITAAHSAAAGVSRRGEHVWQGLSLSPLLATPVRETTAEPDDFVTTARAVLARVAARPALPLLDAPGAEPVALDEVTSLHTGVRPGALVEVRAVRQRQLDGQVLVADSVPVVLRSPRPLPLEDGAAGDEAAGTRPRAVLWGRRRTVAATTVPNDIATFEAPSGSLEVSLVSPPRGTVAADWGRPLQLWCQPTVAGTPWSVAVRLASGGSPLPATRVPGADVPAVVPDPDDVPAGCELLEVAWEAVADAVAGTRAGETLELVVEAHPSDQPHRSPRRLSLPVRVAAAGVPTSVLEPRFLRFGDPEHDRRISSAVARVDAGEDVLERTGLTELRLSASRTSVAAGDRLVVGLVTRAPTLGTLGTTAVSLHHDRPGRTDPSGIDLGEGVADQEQGEDGSVAVRTVRTARLPEDLTTQDGIRLVATVTTTRSGVAVTERLALVLPVVDPQPPPGPSAAYALLRADAATPGRVSCPLYALRPAATRTELVDPRDVFADVMRQRAVFHWTDVVRVGSDVSYAVQKISSRGETHVPDLAGVT